MTDSPKARRGPSARRPRLAREAAQWELAMHPQVIGRGHRMAMLERFLEHARAGAEFARMGDVAQQL